MIFRRLTCSFCLAGLLIAGCQTPTPPAPPVQQPMRVGIAPRPLRTAGATAAGNEYEIVMEVSTNRPDWPACDQYGEPVPKRVHMFLSTDGGSNLTRNIAFGIPMMSYGDPITNRSVSYTYALPWWDESIISEHARIVVTDLDGNRLTCSSGDFTIAGLFWHTPIEGETLTHNTYVELEWVQAGAGDSAEFGYITPTNEFTVISVLSNLVAGVNSYTWHVSGVPYPVSELRLVVRSVSDPIVWGASGTVSTE